MASSLSPLDVACPVCYADVGVACRKAAGSRKGQPISYDHPARVIVSRSEDPFALQGKKPVELRPIDVGCPTCGAPQEATCHTVGAVTRRMRGFHPDRRSEAAAMEAEMARRRKDDAEQGATVPAFRLSGPSCRFCGLEILDGQLTRMNGRAHIACPPEDA